MKSFKQFDESHTVALNSAEDDNLHLANIQDEKVMQRLNGFVGGIAQQEYMQPDAAMKQLQNKLNIVGLSFKEITPIYHDDFWTDDEGKQGTGF